MCVFLLGRVHAQDSLEQRLEAIFGNTTVPTRAPGNSSTTTTPRAGFDVIVQPDPIVEVRMVWWPWSRLLVYKMTIHKIIIRTINP